MRLWSYSVWQHAIGLMAYVFSLLFFPHISHASVGAVVGKLADAGIS